MKDWEAFVHEVEQAPGRVLRKGGGQGSTTLRTLYGQDCYVKVYEPSTWRRRLRDAMGWLRSLQEWEINCRATEAGIGTATFLAALAIRRPFATRHLLIMKPAPGQSLAQWMRSQKNHPEERRRLVSRVASFTAWMHRKAHLAHAHYNCDHIFLTEKGEITLIDLEHALIAEPLPEKRIQRNLRQIRKGLRKFIPESEWQEFLRIYEREDFTANTSNEAHTSLQRAQ